MPQTRWPKLFANFHKAHQYLLKLDKYTDDKFQLTRIKAFLNRVGNPQNSYKTVHVAGTSGKGSTCVMLAAILQAAGYKTGLALSPYLSNPLEKIRLNNRQISEKDFLALLNEYKDLILKCKLTYFEAFIALTFIYFKEKKVDYAIIETGLGGRLDATNVISDPALAIVTTIGLDHEDVLGDTKEKIAKEKEAIIKDPKKAITGSRYIKNAKFINIKKYQLLTCNLQLTTFNYGRLRNIKLSLPGEYQIKNAILAIEAAKFLQINNKYIYQGLAEAELFGRFSLIKRKPLVIADGAHNPDKMSAFVSSLKKVINFNDYNTPSSGDSSFAKASEDKSGSWLNTKKASLPTSYHKRYLLIGIKFDKDYKKILRIITPYFDEIIITTFPLSQNPILLKKAIKNKKVKIIKDSREAYQIILKRIEKKDLLIITGSLYMIGDIFKKS